MSLFRSLKQVLSGPEGHLSDEGVALYVDALRLDRVDELPSFMLEHVEECLTCKIEISELDDATSEMDYSEMDEPPFLKKRKGLSGARHIPMIYRIAAIITISISLGMLFIFVVEKRTPASADRIANNEVDTASMRKGANSRKPAVYAADFTPLPKLEYLVGSNLRSGAIQLVAPQIGSALRFPVTFRWHVNEPGQTVFKLVSNSDSLVVKESTSCDSIVVDKLSRPGLYYWILEQESEILSVGKFYVYADSAR